MIWYVSIKNAKREVHKSRDYTIGGKVSEIIDIASDSYNFPDKECAIILHANDIDINNIDRLLEIDKKNNIFLFTNDTGTSHVTREGFKYCKVYTWDKIVKHFPNLPPPDEKSFNNLIALYLLCKGYIAGTDKLAGTPEKIREWWKFIERESIQSEINELQNSDHRDKATRLLGQLKDELVKENMEVIKIQEIALSLKNHFTEIEQHGGFL